MSERREYEAVYERDEDGRWNVSIPAIDGCYTYGATIDQARGRIREALGLFVTNADGATIVDRVNEPKSESICNRVDVDVSVCYLRFADGPADHGDDIGRTARGETVIAKYDKDGRIIGFQLAGAGKPCQKASTKVTRGHDAQGE